MAIETSSRLGSVSLGCGDELLDTAVMPPQVRHRVDLMPSIDQLCRQHKVAPSDLAHVYVSIGPGSFTGLRVAVTTVKTLAQILDVKIIAVPTLDVIAANVAPDSGSALAVCLNMKRSSCYSTTYSHDNNQWRAVTEPAVRTMEQLLDESPRPLMIAGDPLPPLPDSAQQVRVLDAAAAQPDSRAVWQLGRVAAKQQKFDDPRLLQPLYAREPEAVTLWQKRQREMRQS